MRFTLKKIVRNTLFVICYIWMSFHMEYDGLRHTTNRRKDPSCAQHHFSTSINTGQFHRHQNCKISTNFELDVLHKSEPCFKQLNQ